MKRDPRLRRSSEQRSSAHGGKYGRRPRYRATQTRSDAIARLARGMRLPPELLGPSPFLFGYAEQQRVYIDHVLAPHARRVGQSAELVGFDLEKQAHTYERIPPDEIA